MTLNLTSQVAVVIGGANGIGAAIAKAFADEGATVATVDLKAGVSGLSVIADATQFEQVQTALEAIQTQLGPIRHAVFAVGCGSGHFGFPFWNVPLSGWERVLRVNLLAAANAAYALAPIFTSQKSGTLTFLSSVAGQVGSQTDPPYSAAKAGLLNWMEVCAKDFAPFGVRVNAICPGMVQTAINRSVWQGWHDSQPSELQRSYEEWGLEKVKKIAPLGRWQTPEDIAAMAVFLASERAMNITGQTINIDGGQVMHW